MTRLLTWRAAEREDRAALQEFTCTVSEQRLFGQARRSHPKPWERSVQSFIRSCQPPAAADESLLLGEDRSGVAAVCAMAEQGSPALVKIRAVAVAVRYRGQGGSLADEALEVALETAAARGREEGLDAVRLVGWVDPRNDASKRLNTRAGFACRKITSDGLEEWVLELNLG